jgi:hypothetical protein
MILSTQALASSSAIARTWPTVSGSLPSSAGVLVNPAFIFSSKMDSALSAVTMVLGIESGEPESQRNSARIFCSRTTSPLASPSSSVATSWRAKYSGLPPSKMSVPRPAMLVEMVTPPKRPAWAMISPSARWNLALRTTWGMSCFFSSREITSDLSTFRVPTKIGWPRACRVLMSLTTELNFSASLL